MLKPDAQNCAICGTETPSIHPLERIDGMLIHCPLCGEYEITGQGYSNLKDTRTHAENRHLISGVARNHSERGERLLIRTDNLDAILAAASPPRNPLEAIQRVLLLIHERTVAANDYIKLDNNAFPLIYARSI